jgi:hypothetical protein
MSNSLVVVIIGLGVLSVVVELIVAFGAWSKTQGNLCVAFSVNKEVPQHWSRLFMTKKEQSQCELTIRRQQRLYKRGMKSENKINHNNNDNTVLGKRDSVCDSSKGLERYGMFIQAWALQFRMP